MKLKNNLLILERSAGKLELNKEQSGAYVLEGIFGEIDVKNKNNRIYTEDEYVPQIEALQDKIKSSKLLGELDHPANFDVSLKNVSHIIEDLSYDKTTKQVKGRIRLLDTEQGRQAKALVDAGIPLQISSRAAGAVESNGKVKIKQLFTYDLVADPGFSNAELKRVNESYGFANDADVQIFEINKIIEKPNNNTENKKTKTMVNEDTSRVVSVEDFNNYSKYLSDEIKGIKEAITSLKESNGNSISSEEMDKIKEYTNYIAETLDKNISYTEHTADGVNKVKEYTNYLAESFNESATSFEALNEKLEKVAAYTEYVAETVNKNLIMEDRAEDISKADMERGTPHETEDGLKLKHKDVPAPEMHEENTTLKVGIQKEWNKLDVEITEKSEEVEEDRAEDIENDINDLGETKDLEDSKELQAEAKKTASQESKELKEEESEEESEEPTASSEEEVAADAESAAAPVGESEETTEVEETEESDEEESVEETKESDEEESVEETEESDEEEVDEALDAGDADKGAAKNADEKAKDVSIPKVFHGETIDETPNTKDEVTDGVDDGDDAAKVVVEDRAEDIEADINTMGEPKSLEGEEEEKVAEEVELDIVSEEELALNKYKDEVESKLSAIIENNNKPKSTKPHFFNFVSESVQSDFDKLNEEEQGKVLKSVEGRGFLSESQIVNLWTSALSTPVEEELNVIKMMPAEYKEAFDNLSEAKKASILAQSNYHQTETQYQVNNFWQTRDLREDKHQKVMEKLITENKSTEVEEKKSNLPYDLEVMKSQITKRFKYKK